VREISAENLEGDIPRLTGFLKSLHVPVGVKISVYCIYVDHLHLAAC
jgi:hypothetical protein